MIDTLTEYDCLFSNKLKDSLKYGASKYIRKQKQKCLQRMRDHFQGVEIQCHEQRTPFFLGK